MKLNAIIYEGVYIGDYSGLSPADIADAKAQGGRNRGSGLTPLYMGSKLESGNREYLWRDKDHPSDIVHIEPLNKVESLPIIPADPNARRSFKGVTIFYAFHMVSPKEFEDESILSHWPPIELIQIIKELKNKHLTPTGSIKSKPTRKQHPLDHNYTRSIDDDSSIEDLKELSELASKQRSDTISLWLNRIIDYMKTNKVKKVGDILKTKSFEHTRTNKSGLPKKVKFVSRNEFAAAHLNYAMQSLAKKIKNPLGPNETAMSINLTKAAVEALIKHVDFADIIAFPKSSSKYNEDMAYLIQRSGWNNSQIVEVDKMTGNQAAQHVDWGSFLDKAERVHESYASDEVEPEEKVKINKKRLINIANSTFTQNAETLPGLPLKIGRSNYEVLPTKVKDLPDDYVLSPKQPQWVEWWVAEKVMMATKFLKRIGNKPVPIKSLTNFDIYKKYLQIFKLSQYKINLIRGKRVLVIDDNVNHSSTMQMVHNVIDKAKPKEVILFTPFAMYRVGDN